MFYICFACLLPFTNHACAHTTGHIAPLRVLSLDIQAQELNGNSASFSPSSSPSTSPAKRHKKSNGVKDQGKGCLIFSKF